MANTPVVSGYNPVGLTPESFKNMQLDAGAFFINLDTSTVKANPDTGRVGMYAEEFADILKAGLAEGKALGATSGGGSFQAVPEVRQISADDMRSPIIGSTVFDAWEVKMTTTLKEITENNLRFALATATTDKETGAMMIGNTLLPDHYIKKMGWAGRLLDGRLLYIELDNVLNIVGTNLTFVDKGEGVIAVEYRAHQADLTKMEFAPCKIFFFDRKPIEMTDEEKVAADKTDILAMSFEIPLTAQTDQDSKNAWLESTINDVTDFADAAVTFDTGIYTVVLTLRDVTETFALTNVTEEI